MVFNTTRFGKVELPDDKIIVFNGGLLGFEQEKRFGLLPFAEEENCPLEWMQSAQTPDLAFIVTDPNIFVPDYSVDLLDMERSEIDLSGDKTFILKVIVTVPEIYINMTANLVGPLVINPSKMIGNQLILTTPQYATRHYLFPEDIRSSQKMVF